MKDFNDFLKAYDAEIATKNVESVMDNLSSTEQFALRPTQFAFELLRQYHNWLHSDSRFE